MPPRNTPEFDRFYLHIIFAYIAIVIIGAVGCRALRIDPQTRYLAECVAVLSGTTGLVPLFLHDRGYRQMRDALATIPILLGLVVLLPLPVLIAARIGMPLRDHFLARLDAKLLGVNVLAISGWARQHTIGHALEIIYWRITPFMAAAVLGPALAGRALVCRRYLLSNLYALALSLPLFALAPAVGPFYGHAPATATQTLAQQELLTLRAPRPYQITAETQLDIISFPSFHVIWVALAAASLSSFRKLRVPAWSFAILTVVSTLTTGWHYGVDVIAGLVVAAVSWKLACLSSNRNPGPAPAAAG